MVGAPSHAHNAFTLFTAMLLVASDGWVTIDAAAARELRRSSFFAALVDVRREDEWAAGHLPNATFIPSLQTTGNASALAGCEHCPVAVYCRSGRRSKAAADVLEAAGYSNVYDVLGILQWTAAGEDLVQGPSHPAGCRAGGCLTVLPLPTPQSAPSSRQPASAPPVATPAAPGSPATLAMWAWVLGGALLLLGGGLLACSSSVRTCLKATIASD